MSETNTVDALQLAKSLNKELARLLPETEFSPYEEDEEVKWKQLDLVLDALVSKFTRNQLDFLIEQLENRQ